MADDPLSSLEKLDPELLKHVRGADEELIFGAGAVPRKYKLLIAMAFDAVHGAEGGVRALANSAIAAGATRQEIAEVLRVAYHLGGVGALYVASRALKDVVR
jgi:alkylhydroperoxidase/carboxymuconolactone decarboxylase family protein YurZ